MIRLFVDPDISVAKTLHTDFYLEEQFFADAKEKIFDACWHFAGDAGLVSAQHNCHPFILLPEYLNEPLVLTKDNAGKIHCLSNVCTHRGNLVVNQPCSQPHLRCRYHGRLFQHNGQFTSMPEFKEVKNFPTESDNLAQLPMFEWGKWLFTSLQTRRPASAFLADMMQRVHWLPVHEFVPRPELFQTFMINAHWALYCENYLEGFHIPFVHAGLNSVIDYGAYTTELFPYSNLQLGIAKDKEICFDLPSSSPDYGKKVAAYYFFVFPNLMFNFYPWGLSLNIVEPVSMHKTRVRFLSYVWKDELLESGAGSSLGRVELEDEEVVEAVQRGICSRYYQHGRYSVTREQGTHHFHRLICDFMNDIDGNNTLR